MPDDDRSGATVPPRDGGACAHSHIVRILSYEKCTGCGRVSIVPDVDYDPGCDDCDFGTHRCRRCEATVGHSERHRCPLAVKR